MVRQHQGQGDSHFATADIEAGNVFIRAACIYGAGGSEDWDLSSDAPDRVTILGSCQPAALTLTSFHYHLVPCHPGTSLDQPTLLVECDSSHPAVLQSLSIRQCPPEAKRKAAAYAVWSTRGTPV